MQNGFSRAEAENLSQAERLAVRYVVAMQNGFKVNWETGETYQEEAK